MKHLVFSSSDAVEAMAVWRLYREHLQRIEANLPIDAGAFACQEWYYDHNDHRCPHDSWLMELIIADSQGGNSGKSPGRLNIVVRLLGAYHDRVLTLKYHNVRSYRLLRSPVELRPPTQREKHCHGDWLVDEFDLTADGYVTHEIEWSGAGIWHIESEDISFADSPT